MAPGGARPPRGVAYHSRLERGPAPHPPHAAPWALQAPAPPPDFPVRSSRASLPPTPTRGRREKFRSLGADGARMLTLPAVQPRPAPHGLGSFCSAPGCAGLLQRVGGRRCGEQEPWEGQPRQYRASGRPGRLRPCESLAAQTGGKEAPESPLRILIHLGPWKGHIL